MSIESMKLALSALEDACGDRCNAEYNPCSQREAITALRQAIALQTLTDIHQEIEQEPVAWELRMGKTDRVLIEITNNPQRAQDWRASLCEVVPLYTAPPQRQPLTDEELKKIWYDTKTIVGFYSFQEIAQAIEAKLNGKK